MIPSHQLLSRALIVGQDPDVGAALHLHLERAGWALFCMPSPELLDGLLRTVAPHAIILLLPAQPDASWGSALTTAASAARVGIRVIVVAPSREVVEPLAAVAGAERALARAEVLARPMSVVERSPASAAPGASMSMPPPVTSPMPAPFALPLTPQATSRPTSAEFGIPPGEEARPNQGSALTASPPHSESRPAVDLMALIDEELVGEPRNIPVMTRVEVNVSLVSEHNFYVGPTRHIDSGGVFISSMMPPPVGTHLQVRLGLADGRKLELEGEVVFLREKSAISGRQPAGCGVKLFGLPTWATDAIDRFLLARPPIVYVPR